jgi:hypothetical protein
MADGPKFFGIECEWKVGVISRRHFTPDAGKFGHTLFFRTLRMVDGNCSLRHKEESPMILE